MDTELIGDLSSLNIIKLSTSFFTASPLQSAAEQVRNYRKSIKVFREKANVTTHSMRRFRSKIKPRKSLSLRLSAGIST